MFLYTRFLFPHDNQLKIKSRKTDSCIKYWIYLFHTKMYGGYKNGQESLAAHSNRYAPLCYLKAEYYS